MDIRGLPVRTLEFKTRIHPYWSSHDALSPHEAARPTNHAERPTLVINCQRLPHCALYSVHDKFSHSFRMVNQLPICEDVGQARLVQCFDCSSHGVCVHVLPNMGWLPSVYVESSSEGPSRKDPFPSPVQTPPVEEKSISLAYLWKQEPQPGPQPATQELFPQLQALARQLQ